MNKVFNLKSNSIFRAILFLVKDALTAIVQLLGTKIGQVFVQFVRLRSFIWYFVEGGLDIFTCKLLYRECKDSCYGSEMWDFL